MSFDTAIADDDGTLTGPLREPAQMLADQTYGGHTSVHDGDTAAELGLAGAPIEGPTHFSQIDPLAVQAWGQRWFESGCVSAHFLNMVVDGEQVRASLRTTGPDVGKGHGGQGGRDTGARGHRVGRIRRRERARRAVGDERRAIPGSCTSSTSSRSA